MEGHIRNINVTIDYNGLSRLFADLTLDRANLPNAVSGFMIELRKLTDFELDLIYLVASEFCYILEEVRHVGEKGRVSICG